MQIPRSAGCGIKVYEGYRLVLILVVVIEHVTKGFLTMN